MTKDFDFLFTKTQQTQNVFTLSSQGTVQDTNGVGKHVTELRIGVIVMNGIQTNFSKVSRYIAPPELTENSTIKYTHIIMEKTEPGHLPESGMTRSMTITWMGASETVQRKGISFRISRQKLESAEGPMVFEQLISKMSETMGYAVDADSIFELIRQKKNFTAAMIHLPVTDNIEQIAKRVYDNEVKYWAATAQEFPLRDVNRHANMEISGMGGSESVVIMDFRTADMICNHKSMMEFYTKGAIAELNIAQGGKALSTTGFLPTGEPVIKLKSHRPVFEREDIRRSPLEVVSQIGDFFFAESIKPEERGGVPYESRQMDVQVYNEGSDQFEVVKFLDMLRYSGRFGPDGSLRGPNTFDPTGKQRRADLPLESVDPFEYEYFVNKESNDGTTGDVDIGEKFRRSASLIGNIDIDQSFFSNFSDSVIQSFLRTSRMPEQNFFSIWTDGLNAYDQLANEPYNAALAAKFEATKYALTNDGTSVALVEAASAGTVPFGFASLGGMKEIARNAPRAETLKYDKELFAKVAAFMALFTAFVDFLLRIFPDHPMLDPRNIAPHSFGKGPEYVFFGNLFASSREFNIFHVSAAIADGLAAVTSDLGTKLKTRKDALKKDYETALAKSPADAKTFLTGLKFKGSAVNKEETLLGMDFETAIQQDVARTDADDIYIGDADLKDAIKDYQTALKGVQKTPEDAFKEFMSRTHNNYAAFDTLSKKAGHGFEHLIILYHYWNSYPKVLTNSRLRDLEPIKLLRNDVEPGIPGSLKKWGLSSGDDMKGITVVKKAMESDIKSWRKYKSKSETRPGLYNDANLAKVTRTPLVWTPQIFKSFLDPANNTTLVPSQPDTPFIPYLEGSSVAIDEDSLEIWDEYKEYYKRLSDDPDIDDLFTMHDLNEIKQTKFISTQAKFPCVHSKKMILDGLYKPDVSKNPTTMFSVNVDRDTTTATLSIGQKALFANTRRSSASSISSQSSPSMNSGRSARRRGTKSSLGSTFRAIDPTIPESRDVDYFFDTLSERFLNLLHNLSIEVKNNLERGLAFFGAFTYTNLQQTILMYNSNILLPYEGIGARPFKRYRALSVIKAAPNIGKTYYKPAIVQITPDANGDIDVSCSMQYRSVFPRVDNVYVMHGAHVLEPLAGASNGFFIPHDGITNYNEMSKHPNSPSIIAIIVPYGKLPKRGRFDITGFYNLAGKPYSSHVFEDNKYPHYPGYEFVKEQFLTGFSEQNWMVTEFDPHQCINGKFDQGGINTLVLRTTYIRYQGKGLKEIVVRGNCHWGAKRTTPRAREIRYEGGRITDDFWESNPKYITCF